VHVVIIAYPDCLARDVMAMKDFLHAASLIEDQVFQENLVTCSIVSEDGLPVQSCSGSLIDADCSLLAVQDADLIVVPSMDEACLEKGIQPNEDVENKLSELRSRQIPILALGNGAIGLGRLGLLKGKIVAINKSSLSRAEQQFPESYFVNHNSFISSRGIYSSVSLYGGIDAILYRLAKFRGDQFANFCAALGQMTSSECFVPVIESQRDHEDQVILRAQAWMDSHFQLHNAAGEIAALLDMSSATLKRRFKKATGLSVSRYIQLLRIQRAKQLLLTSGRTVNDIATFIGYANQSFFANSFKKETGLTPTKYRNELNVVLNLP
jgi:transcriptional regulator GlxA family with amidase domain